MVGPELTRGDSLGAGRQSVRCADRCQSEIGFDAEAAYRCAVMDALYQASRDQSWVAPKSAAADKK